MRAVIEDGDALRSSFERFSASQVTGEPGWLRERRAAAFARYVERGLPGPRDEGWRHTPTAPLVRTQFAPADPSLRPDPSTLALVPGDVWAAELVFVNGRLAPGLSRTDSHHAGLRVRSLRDGLAEAAHVERLFGKAAAERLGVFADLNTAFATDGALVELAPGAAVERPLHLVHLSAADGAPSLSYLRTLIVAGRDSELRVVESFAGPEARAYMVNAVTEVLLEDGARLDHYKLQREGSQGLHVATLAAALGRDAVLRDHALTLGAALSRNEIDVRFEGEGGELRLDGLFVVDGQRVADTHSRVEHGRPHCSSRQLYKGVLAGQGRGVFNGLVRVRPGAQKTDAAQTNKNLLLSREALVHSIPQLEIEADDVKCKHGSTTGQLDEKALFYLRSRGIAEQEARGMLSWAFANDVLSEVAVDGVRLLAERRLRAQLADGGRVAEGGA